MNENNPILSENFKTLAKAMTLVAQSANMVISTINNFALALKGSGVLDYKFPNKHVEHLFRYGYGRTQKKNFNRCRKDYMKQLKRRKKCKNLTN